MGEQNTARSFIVPAKIKLFTFLHKMMLLRLSGLLLLVAASLAMSPYYGHSPYGRRRPMPWAHQRYYDRPVYPMEPSGYDYYDPDMGGGMSSRGVIGAIKDTILGDVLTATGLMSTKGTGQVIASYSPRKKKYI